MAASRRMGSPGQSRFLGTSLWWLEACSRGDPFTSNLSWRQWGGLAGHPGPQDSGPQAVPSILRLCPPAPQGPLSPGPRPFPLLCIAPLLPHCVLALFARWSLLSFQTVMPTRPHPDRVHRILQGWGWAPVLLHVPQIILCSFRAQDMPLHGRINSFPRLLASFSVPAKCPA